MRTPIIAGNWKMNLTRAQAVALAGGVAEACANIDGVEVVVGPTFVCLDAVIQALEGTRIGVAAQNMHHAASGAFTGEVSAQMLKHLGCRYVLLGHSERRQYFGETDEGVHRKVHAALAQGLAPIVCTGESLAEREADETARKVELQVRAALTGVPADHARTIILAYEPLWAIGTGKTATPEQAQEVHAQIRALLTEMYGEDTAEAMRIQYGGSVKPKNIAELIAQPDIDGALVGGASLKADSFHAIVAASA
ncbi:MAG: triose-phosphate isomerase [Myxococcota bacterium]